MNDNDPFENLLQESEKSDDLIKTSDDSSDDSKLTEEGWQEIVNLWNTRKDNPPSIMEMVQLVTKGKHPDWDGRTILGKTIRKRLSEAKLKAPTTAWNNFKKEPIDLTEEQREYIRNNYENSTCLEMAALLFNKNDLTNLSQETRTIIEYVKFVTPVTPKNTFEDPKTIITESYSPPKSIEGVIKKVNKYRHEQIDKEKLTGKQKKDITALLGYLNTYRFIRQINTYTKNDDRDLFESTFIRYTYDKFDLTEEEADQNILLATEVVKALNIQGRIEMLRRLLDDASGQEDPKISMSLVEAISTAETEYNQCLGRQSKLLDSLKVKRSEKEGKDKGGAASILNLVQLWKDEESRTRMIRFAEKRKENLKKGAEELMSMDELKCRIVGLGMDEILNG